MFSLKTDIKVGSLGVTTTDHKGHSVEEVAEAVMSALEIEKPIKWLGDDANWKGDNKLIRTNNSLLKAEGWNLKFAKSKDVIFDIVSRSK